MKTATFGLVFLLFIGCGGKAKVSDEGKTRAAGKPLLNVKVPDALPVPSPMVPKSDTDWEAIVHNKEIEVIQVINVINPVAAFIKEGFKQYGTRFSPMLQEEWRDTQEQLGKALKLYDACKARRAEGNYDKQLFLDLEETWQLLVKTGTAGVRTKTMVEAEIRKLTGV